MADAPAHLHRHGVFRRDRCSPGFHRRAEAGGYRRHAGHGRGGIRPFDRQILARTGADVLVRVEARLAAEFRLWRWRTEISDPPGRDARRLADGAVRADDTRRGPRDHDRGFRPHGALQGHERDKDREVARDAQRACHHSHHRRPAVRRADGAGGRGRETVFLAGHRLAAGRQCPAARHSGRPGLHSCRGAVLSRHQSADRFALRRDRSQDQIRMKLRANLLIGGALFALAILVGLLAPWLAHTDPVLDAHLLNSEGPPRWAWWFGTDDQGRDIFSRVVYGARVSPTVGIVSQLINSVIGVALGLSAGYWGGWWDDVVNALTNLMLAIPSLIFALAIMAVLGPGLTSLLIALGLTNWSFTCRIARASALSLRSQGYVQAATVLGYGDLRIMITQLLPNMLGPIVVIGTLGMGSAGMAEAAVSFLGLGVRPPFPSLGSMVSEARVQITTAPCFSIFPGLAIFLTVLGLNLLGDGLRDILDPQSRSRRT